MDVWGMDVWGMDVWVWMRGSMRVWGCEDVWRVLGNS